MLDTLEKMASSTSKRARKPDWVSDANASGAAYQEALALYDIKLQYINRHKKIGDFRVKRNYHISASEVCRAIGISLPTLTATSSYAVDFTDYLKSLNDKLLDLKEKRLDKTKSLRAKGNHKKTKDELLALTKELSNELEKTRKTSAKHQIEELLKDMPATTKKKLGFNI